MKMIVIWLKFHWGLFPNYPIDNKPSLAPIMSCGRIGVKPLYEPMVALLFTEAIK